MTKSRFTGAEDMAAVLRALPREAMTGLNAAARKSLRPMLKRAKAAAPVDDGHLKKSLTIKRDGRAPKAQPRFVVGPSSTYQVGNVRPVKYAHITEFGKADGSVPGTRWMTGAWEESKQEIIDTLGKEAWIEIEKAIARKIKREAKKLK